MRLAKESLNKRRRGGAAVETAVVLPLLLILLFGAIKYGWIFYRMQQITNITRHATRVAIRAGDHSAEAQQLITDRMTECNITGASVTAPYGWNPAARTELVIEITVPTANIDIVKMNSLLPTPENLTARVAMCKEG